MRGDFACCLPISSPIGTAKTIARIRNLSAGWDRIRGLLAVGEVSGCTVVGTYLPSDVLNR